MEEIKYTDEGDNYLKPERQSENEAIEIRLYCRHKNCNKYIKGVEGYNGNFKSEIGTHADLRNVSFDCGNHKK